MLCGLDVMDNAIQKIDAFNKVDVFKFKHRYATGMKIEDLRFVAENLNLNLLVLSAN